MAIFKTHLGNIKGDKGDPLKYEDLTQEQLDDLVRRLVEYMLREGIVWQE